MKHKVKAIIDFNEKEDGKLIKRIANKSIWEIEDEERIKLLLEKGAIEILPEIEIKKERKTSRERRDKFML